MFVTQLNNPIVMDNAFK